MDSEVHLIKRAKWKEYKRMYRSRRTEVILSFTNEEFASIKRAAKEKGLSPTGYIKALIRADLTSAGYIIPRESKLLELIYQFRKVGGNLNQLAQFCNDSKTVTRRDIDSLKGYLNELEDKVLYAFSRPQTLESFIEEELREHPEKKERLLALLQSLP